MRIFESRQISSVDVRFRVSSPKRLQTMKENRRKPLFPGGGRCRITGWTVFLLDWFFPSLGWLHKLPFNCLEDFLRAGVAKKQEKVFYLDKTHSVLVKGPGKGQAATTCVYGRDVSEQCLEILILLLLVGAM